MKKRLSVWWEQSAWKARAARLPRRPRLNREKRLAVNLVVIVLAGLWLWGLAGYPLPTAEMEFRRLERTNLLPRSQIVFAAPEPLNDLEATDGTGLCLIDRVTVGVGTDWITVGYPLCAEGRWDTVDVFSLEEAPSPVPLTNNLLTVPGREDLAFSTPLLFCRVPAEAAWGELELDIRYLEQDYHRDCDLWNLEDGMWLAAVIPPEESYSSDWYLGASYTLRLYRADGSLLLEQAGTIPGAA